MSAPSSTTTMAVADPEKRVLPSEAVINEDNQSPPEGQHSIWEPQEERKLVRKIDLRIFPVLIILFILNFVDRNNFANARLQGLEKDLHLTDVQYNTCLSIFLVGYVAFQIPSNMFLNTIPKPSIYLCACVSTWGVISMSMAATQNATGAIVARFFLGILESAFFPGCLFYLSRWYTRKEMQLRVSLLNVGNLTAQAFGGLMAAGILTNLNGAHGIEGWRYLFIIEGSLTVTTALLAMLVLPDYPSTTTWLSSRERLMAESRLTRDLGLPEEHLINQTGAFHGLKLAVTDPKVWFLGIIDMSMLVGLSFSFFFPTISASLGFNATISLFVSLINAWHSDRTGERFVHCVWPSLVCILGYIISITTTKIGPRYFSMFLTTIGYSSALILLAWTANSIPDSAERAAGIALVNAMGNIGSIPGIYMWPIRFGPLYHLSFAATIAAFGLTCVLAYGLRFYLRHLNKVLDREEARRALDELRLNGSGVLNVVTGELTKFRYLY